MRQTHQFLAPILVFWSTGASAQLPCGTPEHLSHITARPAPAHMPPPDDHLEDRDPFSVESSRVLGTHFVVKWGSEHPLSTEQSETLLAQFETAHDVQVTDWEMPDPTGIDGTYFNVYVGDTGDEVPSASGSGGYFTLDGEGFPYIVLNRHAIGDWTYMQSIVVHEFFHAVQWGTGAFSLTMAQRWYWEATATWATGRIMPEHDYFYYWLPWYALRPTTTLEHHSLDEYGGEPPDLHQYGAFILPWYISENIGEGVVLSSWREGGSGEDPLDALDTELAEIEIKDVLADHAAANLAWDYALGDGFSEQMREFEEAYAHRDTRFTTAVEDEDDWWVHADSGPDSFGYHYVQLPEALLERAEMGLDIAMAIEPDVPAGLPSTLRFRGRLVSLQDGVSTTHFIDEEALQTWMDIDPATDELWLAVVNTTAPEALRDTPAYRFRWIPVPEPPEDTGEPGGDTGDTGESPPDLADTGTDNAPDFQHQVTGKHPDGCSCASGKGPGLAWLMPLLLLVRRRGDTA